MSPHKEGLQIVYLTVLLFGVLGNMFLLYLHGLKFIAGHKKRLISLIIINLALAHTLMIIFRGIPIIIATLGWRSFLDDVMGKILTYLIRVTRVLSLCSTFLLSVFQAITISPNSCIWTEIKTRTYKYIIPCTLFCGIFSILIDVTLAANIRDKRNSSNESWKIGHSSFNYNAINVIIWNSVLDALFMGLMICSSVYMVFVLHRHSQQVQYIHSTSPSPKASPETRATKAILMLVITFVCFNSFSSPFIIYMTSINATRHWEMCFTVILSLVYPIVSPFILIITDTQMPRSLHVLLVLKSFVWGK
ncbi:vomeronasal type-1 receptor 1-like [Petaurus breviceps papuanus]|uniref:vomeronasal type-1 receptor 1-like n=1 Tax=Petaurus breviceps papuanus TaxID=3040969 RepID=UPI0036D77ADC